MSETVSGPIYYHIYVSVAVRPFSTDELTALLRKARESNIRTGITGMLLYKDQSFMQAIEGDRDAVLELVRRIELDPRHRRVTRLFSGEENERQFADWSMGFQDMNAPHIRDLPGYTDFLDLTKHDTQFHWSRQRCLRVLNTLKKLSY